MMTTDVRGTLLDIWDYGDALDIHKPPHVHVERENKTCKFWLEPLGLVRNHGFDARELGRIRQLIGLHHAKIMEAWHEHCG